MENITEKPVTTKTLPLIKGEYEVILVKNLLVKSVEVTFKDGRRILFIREVRNDG